MRHSLARALFNKEDAACLHYESKPAFLAAAIEHLAGRLAAPAIAARRRSVLRHMVRHVAGR